MQRTKSWESFNLKLTEGADLAEITLSNWTQSLILFLFSIFLSLLVISLARGTLYTSGFSLSATAASRPGPIKMALAMQLPRAKAVSAGQGGHEPLVAQPH